MERIVVDLASGTTTIVPLTSEEIAAAQVTQAAWQVEEAARLVAVAAEEARQAKFQEWLATQPQE